VKKPAIVTAVESVENTRVLDRIISDANAVAGGVLGVGWLRDLLRGVPLGHPVHPVAVLVPAGAWISSAVLDFIPGQERAARILIGAGLLGVAPAAASGIADWSLLKRKQQRVGIVHWAANLTAVALYSASYIQRRRGKQISGKVLGLAGLTVVSASGYLGGHLAYRQAANVLIDNEPEFGYSTADPISENWQTLGPLASFQNGKVGIAELDGVVLAVYRDGLDIRALGGTCSHCDDALEMASLDDVADVILECPQDGSRFDLSSGEVLRGPATAPVSRFDAMVSTGMIEIRNH
jgi:nitrite reductase/ring-hydroxylating ferredoxin subunit/uncharacterized membrane protein